MIIRDGCGYLDTVSSITVGLVPKVTVQLLRSCVFRYVMYFSFPKEEPCH